MLTGMEAGMPELAEIKSEIGGGQEFPGHNSVSSSTTPQPHQNNFQWVSVTIDH